MWQPDDQSEMCMLQDHVVLELRSLEWSCRGPMLRVQVHPATLIISSAENVISALSEKFGDWAIGQLTSLKKYRAHVIRWNRYGKMKCYKMIAFSTNCSMRIQK